MVNFKHEQNENPGSPNHFRGFLFRLCKVAYAFRLLLSVISVQPFANVVANYTRYNRNKKCGAYFAHEKKKKAIYKNAPLSKFLM